MIITDWRRAFCFVVTTTTLVVCTEVQGKESDDAAASPPGTFRSSDTMAMIPTKTAVETVDSTIPSDKKGFAGGISIVFDSLGGNLPKVIENRGRPYVVTSDIYVPSGKSVHIEPGVVLLFRNFTGMHVEGRVLVDGTAEKPIVFSSEFDKVYNPSSMLHANPYDWNGITVHESGIGSTFSFATVMYSVFGINSLNKYIKLDKINFSNNGRSDFVIEGKTQAVSSPFFTYALTVDDARKDGIPVEILMDPHAKKRAVFRYGGLSILTAGCVTAVWSTTELKKDQARLSVLSTRDATDDNSNLIKNDAKAWESARAEKDADLQNAVIASILAVLGGMGFGISFTF